MCAPADALHRSHQQAEAALRLIVLAAAAPEGVPLHLHLLQAPLPDHLQPPVPLAPRLGGIPLRHVRRILREDAPAGEVAAGLVAGPGDGPELVHPRGLVPPHGVRDPLHAVAALALVAQCEARAQLARRAHVAVHEEAVLEAGQTAPRAGGLFHDAVLDGDRPAVHGAHAHTAVRGLAHDLDAPAAVPGRRGGAPAAGHVHALVLPGDPADGAERVVLAVDVGCWGARVGCSVPGIMCGGAGRHGGRASTALSSRDCLGRGARTRLQPRPRPSSMTPSVPASARACECDIHIAASARYTGAPRCGARRPDRSEARLDARWPRGLPARLVPLKDAHDAVAELAASPRLRDEVERHKPQLGRHAVHEHRVLEGGLREAHEAVREGGQVVVHDDARPAAPGVPPLVAHPLPSRILAGAHLAVGVVRKHTGGLHRATGEGLGDPHELHECRGVRHDEEAPPASAGPEGVARRAAFRHPRPLELAPLSARCDCRREAAGAGHRAADGPAVAGLELKGGHGRAALPRVLVQAVVEVVPLVLGAGDVVHRARRGRVRPGRGALLEDLLDAVHKV
mmetsp:Transcript_5641/g.19184  ORF Transcript_5641/g.19184 Transcript_5641/m.19184 type:complete len:568 (+) Transcript_5641:194-1897(+)